MKPTVTSGIVLSRVNYQEADRIITILTPDNGKLRVMAKGVRKERSKMAGGVELFSINELSFIRGRGEVCTLVSSRLVKHYGNIVKDIERTMFGYEFLKLINKITEDDTEAEYFELAKHVLDALNDPKIQLEALKLWCDTRLLSITGHAPNLKQDTNGEPLRESKSYDFDISAMGFLAHPNGQYASGHIKLMRLAGATLPKKLMLVDGIEKYLGQCQLLAQTMRKAVLHV